jgi:hypothetical protein
MRKYQNGVTLIGWIFLLAPMALVVYSAIRLVPVYITYMSVSKIMDEMKGEVVEGVAVNPAVLHVHLQTRLDVAGIDKPSSKEIDIHRDGDTWVAVADYEELVPFLGNIALLAQFHKQVTL